ncbi:uridine kinase [Alloactinosynnema sp. L-07]|uniref:uridine kinase family protein n=1 Tax=Alloactinosynnema sp. L-07 TaxID=1653480 RepID=UPI001E54EBB6|nr:(d)CMP kinase [Alloactinosynnema sp. L-07]
MVAIDGPSGAGKSTVAAQLAADLREQGVSTAVVPTDHFATWTDPVAWWPRLVEGVLDPLAANRPGGYKQMIWADGIPRPGDLITVGVPEVLIVEGVSAGRRSVQHRISLLVWAECADPGTRLARSVARDGEASRAELSRWQAFETGWFAVDGTRERADVRVRS